MAFLSYTPGAKKATPRYNTKDVEPGELPYVPTRPLVISAFNQDPQLVFQIITSGAELQDDLSRELAIYSFATRPVTSEAQIQAEVANLRPRIRVARTGLMNWNELEILWTQM